MKFFCHDVKQATTVVGKASAVLLASGLVRLENAVLLVTLSSSGALLSLLDKRVQPWREVVAVAGPGAALDRGCSTDCPAGFGNRLMLYDDVPFYWDAWDTSPYHLDTGRALNGPPVGISTPLRAVTAAVAAGNGPHRVGVCTT